MRIQHRHQMTPNQTQLSHNARRELSKQDVTRRSILERNNNTHHRYTVDVRSYCFMAFSFIQSMYWFKTYTAGPVRALFPILQMCDSQRRFLFRWSRASTSTTNRATTLTCYKSFSSTIPFHVLHLFEGGQRCIITRGAIGRGAGSERSGTFTAAIANVFLPAKFDIV